MKTDMTEHPLVVQLVQLLNQLDELDSRIDQTGSAPTVKLRERKSDLVFNDRVQHKDRGKGRVLEVNKVDAMIRVKWDKQQSTSESNVLGWTQFAVQDSWVGRDALTKIESVHSLASDLDYAGFPPGWREAFMNVFNDRVEVIRPIIVELLRDNRDRSQASFESLADQILKLAVNGRSA